MKYTYEMYEYGSRGRVFLGYKNVNASSNEEALETASINLPANVKLAQIWVAQEKQ